MGLEARVSSLRLLGKKIYIIEDVCSFNFPRTLSHIKAGELESLVNGFTLIEKMMNDLERKYNDGQSEEGSSMTRIMEEKKKKKFTMKQWLSPVIWDEEDDEDDEDDEDTNDDDKDNNH